MSLLVVGLCFRRSRTFWVSVKKCWVFHLPRVARGSYFSDVRIVGVVGGDFGDEERQVFVRHGVDTSDLECVPEGETFRWYGRYDYDLNTAHTLDTRLNVFADFKPKLSAERESLVSLPWQLHRTCSAKFASRSGSQAGCARYDESVDRHRQGVFVANDPWLDVVIINDAEARQLTGFPT